MRNARIQTIVEIALTVALSAVLGWWKVTLPWNFAGGSISLSMLPIIVLAVRRGAPVGIVAGALYGVIDYFYEPYFVHPVQVVLDYGVAFAACGIAGFGRSMVAGALDAGQWTKASWLTAVWGMIGSLGRLAASYVSGVVFFAANAPKGQPVWLYSLVYNLSYLAPSAIVCAALAAVLIPVLDRAVPVVRGRMAS